MQTDSGECPGVSRKASRISAQIHAAAVPHRLEGVVRLGARPEVDHGARAVSQFQVARGEIRVEVRQEDMGYGHVPGFGLFDVLADVALRIHDGRDAGGFVPEEIGRMGEAAQVVLVEYHVGLLSRSGRPWFAAPSALRLAVIRRAFRTPVVPAFYLPAGMASSGWSSAR